MHLTEWREICVVFLNPVSSWSQRHWQAEKTFFFIFFSFLQFFILLGECSNELERNHDFFENIWNYARNMRVISTLLNLLVHFLINYWRNPHYKCAIIIFQNRNDHFCTENPVKQKCFLFFCCCINVAILAIICRKWNEKVFVFSKVTRQRKWILKTKGTSYLTA